MSQPQPNHTPHMHRPERGAREEIERLLAQIRLVTSSQNQPLIDKATHAIKVLCNSYIVDTGEWASGQYGLSKFEARLAELLFSRPGHIFTPANIMDALYFDKHGEPDVKIVDVWACKLRKKLKGSQYRIENAWGRGYIGVVTKAEHFPRAPAKAAP